MNIRTAPYVDEEFLLDLLVVAGGVGGRDFIEFNPGASLKSASALLPPNKLICATNRKMFRAKFFTARPRTSESEH